MSGIVISNLSKRFHGKNKKNAIVACDGINLILKPGELLGLIGPNGSGKTTFLRMLSGVVLADEGFIKINDQDIIRDSEKRKFFVSVVPSDNRNFYLRLTGRENLKFFGVFYHLSSMQAQGKIKELADLLKIEEYLDRMFQEYSSGIKQRFAIARALLMNTPLLLLDEPTKNLDPLMAQAILHFIKEFLVKKENKTVLLTSHTLSEVAEIADRIAILDKGRMKALGTLRELKVGAGQTAENLNDIYNFYLAKNM